MKYPRAIILLCFLAAIVILAVFLVPTYYNLKNIQQKVAVKKTFLDNQNEYYRKLTEIAQKLSQETEVIQKIDTAIPNKIDFSSIVNFLDQTGQETGIIVQSVGAGNQGKKTGQERIRENNFSIILAGTYPAFKNFLYKLENSSRLFEIEDISFSSQRSGSDFFNYNIRLKVSSY
jgi:Tfp pilus assembly protein PilO